MNGIGLFFAGLVFVWAVAWGLASMLLVKPTKSAAKRSAGILPLEGEGPSTLSVGVVCFTSGCGTLNQSGAVFCRTCGERLVGSPMFDPPSTDRVVWRQVRVSEESEERDERGVPW